MKFIILHFLSLLSFTIFCQQEKLVDHERKLLTLYQKMTIQASQGGDSLFIYGNAFEKYLVNTLKQSNTSFAHDFSLLKKEYVLSIATSQDRRFRIYSWDTQTGGTMHFFHNIYQYESEGKVYTQVLELSEDDASGVYTDIYTIESGMKKFYLGKSYSICSTKDKGECIKAFEIHGSVLNDTLHLFKTKKAKLNEISIFYDWFYLSDGHERTTIFYDAVKKSIQIPVVIDDGKITEKDLVYHWDGSWFLFQKIAKHEEPVFLKGNN